MHWQIAIILAAVLSSCIPHKKGSDAPKDLEKKDKKISFNDAPRESYFAPCSRKVINAFKKAEGKGWSSNYHCGNVTAPLYHDQPDRGSFQLPFIYLPPDNKQDDSKPIVFTQGGPGGSSIELIAYTVAEWSPLISKYGMLIFDYRGTDFDNEEWACHFRHHKRAEFKQCLDAWAERIDYHAINTYEIGHDIAFMLDSLHFSKAKFYGVSYGTYVGQMFARLHPDRTESLILDGVATFGESWLQDANLSEILDEAYRNCGASLYCSPTRGKKPDLAAIKQRYDEDPQPIMDGSKKLAEVGGREALFVLMHKFRENYIVGYQHLQEALMRPLYIGEWKNNGIEDSEDMTWFFIACHIFVKDTAWQKKVIGAQNSLLRDFRNEEVVRDCQDILPNGSYTPETPITEASRKVPVILLSGSVDPATPHANAKKVQKHFDLAHDLVVRGGGHGVVKQKCVMNEVEKFLKNPQAKLVSSCDFDEKSWILNYIQPAFFTPPNAEELGLKEKDQSFVNAAGSIYKSFWFNIPGFDVLKFRILMEKAGGKFDAKIHHEVITFDEKSVKYYRAPLPGGQQLAAIVKKDLIYTWQSVPGEEAIFRNKIAPLYAD